ncbi:MAG: UDP-N-acetylmuramate--L-alanine ligase [Vicinamibacterales bacterium]|jgi:UDP-N-acetylmuramate--alanine ligase|nr:UDP-N-acetylmuramate--L-alanine ligase [Vicinamibacterales bacterium]MDP6608942.1 UDP-N-acetylmuramate--L-alanine ligase [Vicinamibacterales bacterium]HAK54294.1 UDP-N-acetylmuramate--L-alanine ligase [Acidobacteriota bacterium]|tara:strand:- start:3821 stop:5254 length:1434 start_codon:yes stop_codon:yes gene_type:complete
MLGRTRRIHFVGIGGSGMCGIAELLVNLGYAVSGSDLNRSPVTDRLTTLGVAVHVGHDAQLVADADVVVVSSAVTDANPEVVEARRRHISVIPRAEMLAELMRLRYGIAVAGSHGKTSTTSMIALVLERGDLDPTAVIGGRLSAFGSNARLGRGNYIVAEADESDRSFLRLSPSIAVITNVDHEHLEQYGTFDGLCEGFVDFANTVPFYGAIVACADDEHLRALLPRMTRRVLAYGLDEGRAVDVAGREVQLRPFGSSCEVHVAAAGGRSSLLGTLHLQVPGRHNLRNALAAVAVGLEAGVGFDRIADALSDFRGVERRFQLRGEVDDVMIVDDYGHHPTEIRAVLSAARAGLDRRVVLVFQPHRYTRTHQLLEEFGRALAGADEVILTEVYGAGEPPISGATAGAIAEAVRRSGQQAVHLVESLDDVAGAVVRLVRPGDLVVTLGAGSIGDVAGDILRQLEARRATQADVQRGAGH